MQEEGIDLSGASPQKLTIELAAAGAALITMRCGWLVIIDARNRPGEHDVKPSEIAVSDHGTLGRLTQFPGRSVVPSRKSLKTNGIAEPYDSKEGSALHCSRPSANR